MIAYILLAFVGGRIHAPWWYFALIAFAIWLKVSRVGIAIVRQSPTDKE